MGEVTKNSTSFICISCRSCAPVLHAHFQAGVVVTESLALNSQTKKKQLKYFKCHITFLEIRSYINREYVTSKRSVSNVVFTLPYEQRCSRKSLLMEISPCKFRCSVHMMDLFRCCFLDGQRKV